MKEENGDNNYKSHDDGGEEKIPLMIRVTAPATLPGGYTFEALINDDPERPFTCEVVCLFFVLFSVMCLHCLK